MPSSRAARQPHARQQLPAGKPDSASRSEPDWAESASADSREQANEPLTASEANQREERRGVSGGKSERPWGSAPDPGPPTERGTRWALSAVAPEDDYGRTRWAVKDKPATRVRTRTLDSPAEPADRPARPTAENTSYSQTRIAFNSRICLPE